MHVAFPEMKSVFAGILVLFFAFRCVEMKIQYITFPEVFSRATAHQPRVLRKSCLLKPDPGPCRANIKMYYFNPEEKGCSTFEWGGCMGNGNRFDSMTECNNVCLSKPNEKSKSPRYCKLSFDYGFCFGAISRWYYDHLWKVCKETIYSGCGGNKNNFYNIEQCESVCRFGIGIITTSPKSTGSMKRLIINPLDATASRGKEQKIIGSTTKKSKSNSTK